MQLLAVESSCDETSAAVVDDLLTVRSNVVYSQVARHQPFGGVVPELASRCHVEVMMPVLEQALAEAGTGWADLDALAVTRGPGLASSLLTGLAATRALALRLDLPLYGVNHLQGHLHSIYLGKAAPSPEQYRSTLVLLVSGGHTALVRLDHDGSTHLLGQTLDDAAGEALDKGASLLGLGYPGGPAIEQAADGGDAGAIPFPGPPRMKASRFSGSLDPRFCFSFSGLKTALLYTLRDRPELREQGLADCAAGYQEAAFRVLIQRARRALEEAGPFEALACVGGVARNRRLRELLEHTAAQAGVPLLLAEPEYCTDNAAMIGAAAVLRRPQLTRPGDPLDAVPNLAVDA